MDYMARKKAADSGTGPYVAIRPALGSNRGASNTPGTNYLQELMALIASRGQAQAAPVDPRVQAMEEMIQQQPQGAEGYAQPIPDPTQGPTAQDFIENILKRNE